MEKKDIRKQMKLLRLQLPEEDKLKAANEVFAHIESLKEFKEAKTILLYYSLPDELPTVDYLHKWNSNKNLLLPKVNGEVLDILSFDITQLATGAFDIQEPVEGALVRPSDIDLIIVPAVAFDKLCNRLGRGKGYYDRLLSSTNALKIGVGYDFQVIDHIPTEEHDIPMDMVITPSYILKYKL